MQDADITTGILATSINPTSELSVLLHNVGTPVEIVSALPWICEGSKSIEASL